MSQYPATTLHDERYPMNTPLYTVSVTYLDGGDWHGRKARGAYAQRDHAASHLATHTLLTTEEINEVLDIVEVHTGPAITRHGERLISVKLVDEGTNGAAL